MKPSIVLGCEGANFFSFFKNKCEVTASLLIVTFSWVALMSWSGWLGSLFEQASAQTRWIGPGQAPPAWRGSNRRLGWPTSSSSRDIGLWETPHLSVRPPSRGSCANPLPRPPWRGSAGASPWDGRCWARTSGRALNRLSSLSGSSGLVGGRPRRRSGPHQLGLDHLGTDRSVPNKTTLADQSVINLL